MTVKETYLEQLKFLENTLERCKTQIKQEGLIKCSGYGANRREEINPTLTLYKTLLPTYLHLLKEYQELKQ